MPAVPTGWEILGAALEAQPRGAPATTHAQFVQLLAPCFAQRQQVRPPVSAQPLSESPFTCARTLQAAPPSVPGSCLFLSLTRTPQPPAPQSTVDLMAATLRRLFQEHPMDDPDK
jgi:hypothetical protein